MPARVSAPTLVRGAVAGVAAYLVGYAFAYLSAAADVQRIARAYQPLADAGGRFVPAWKAAGWAFTDAHFVGTVYPGGAVEMVGFAGVEYLYLVPPLLLLAAGGVVAFVSRVSDRRDGLVAGATVTAGYLPFAVAFALLARYANVHSSLLRALVVAGVVYPVAFGGLGGLAAAVLRED